MLTPPSDWIRSRDEIHQLALLAVVLVEEQVERIEGGAAHLPVVLLVQIAQRDGVGQQLVEVLDARLTDRSLERDGESRNSPIFHCTLVFLRHGPFSLLVDACTSFPMR